MIYRALAFAAVIGTVAWLVMSPGFEPAIVLLLAFAAFFRDDVHGLVGRRFVALAPRAALKRDLSHTRYSFTNPTYVNPMIVGDLNGWLSDLGDAVVAVNLVDANDSNRYFAKIR